MKRLLASTLALCLAATTGLASAQTYRSTPYNSRPYNGTPYYGQDANVRYDYARVIRVDPAFERYGSGYPTSNSQRCYQRNSYVRGDDYYGNDGYTRDGYYRNDGYRDDGYYDQYGNYQRNSGTRTGATVATVIGGIAGAVLGSQVGGGSGSTAAAAVGAMAGGMAGRQIYEHNQRQRQPDRVGTVTVCDPVPASGRGYYSSDRAVEAYDVTYEYGGHQYTARTNYHPGDRIRVRVDVRAE